MTTGIHDVLAGVIVAEIFLRYSGANGIIVPLVTPVIGLAGSVVRGTCSTILSEASKYPKASLCASLLGAGYYFRDELYNMAANSIQNALNQPASVINNPLFLMPIAILASFAAGYSMRRTNHVDELAQRQIRNDEVYARQLAALER